MKLLKRVGKDPPSTLAILSGSFHPVTNAHMALAHAALSHAEEVMLVMPSTFPHKVYEEVTLDRRLEILQAAASLEDRFSVGVTDGGLFLEIATEARTLWPKLEQIWFPCGKDAAERILNWDYGTPNGADEMLKHFGLLVADRQGSLETPAPNVRRLELSADYNEISATEVRRRIKNQTPWEDLVPATALELIREIYR